MNLYKFGENDPITSRLMRYTEFSAGFHLPVQNVYSVTFYVTLYKYVVTETRQQLILDDVEISISNFLFYFKFHKVM